MCATVVKMRTGIDELKKQFEAVEEQTQRDNIRIIGLPESLGEWSPSVPPLIDFTQPGAAQMGYTVWSWPRSITIGTCGDSTLSAQ